MKKCKYCKQNFDPEEKSWWDENGTVSTKLCVCPHCDGVQVLKYGDQLLGSSSKNYNLNKDKRYY